MPIAFVSSGAAAGSLTNTITPAFGQATAAGNLLICCFASQATVGVNPTFNGTGWTITSSSDNIRGIAYKENCGVGETAPTLTFGGVSGGTEQLWAGLSEFSGVLTSSSLDKQGTGFGSSLSTATITNTAVDSTVADLAVVSTKYTNSKQTTYTETHTWSPVNGNAGILQTTAATKDFFLFSAAYYLLSGQGGLGSTADSDAFSANPASGSASASGANGVMASWKTVAIPAPTPKLRYARRPAVRSGPPKRGQFMISVPKLWKPQLWLPAGVS